MAVGHSLSLLHAGGRFFESPRWHHDRWWVSDMFGDVVLGLSPGGEIAETFPLPDHPSGIGWLPDGSMLTVLMRRRAVVRIDARPAVQVHAELGRIGRGSANDMTVGPRGHAWVGSLGFDMTAGERPRPTDMVCVHPNGEVRLAASDLLTPNGAVILSDASTLVVAETFASRLTAFRILEDGTLAERSVFAQLAPPPPLDDLRTCLRNLRVAPDGLAVDADDCLWVADAAGGGCFRVAEGGGILERVEAPPGLNVFACALGGSGGTTLLLCCAPDALESRRVQATDSVLLTTEVTVPAAANRSV